MYKIKQVQFIQTNLFSKKIVLVHKVIIAFEVYLNIQWCRHLHLQMSGFGKLDQLYKMMLTFLYTVHRYC